MVLTFPGKKARQRFTYSQSYDILTHEWNKFRKLIKYHFPDFKWIRMPRAQTNPFPGNPIGYCHEHLITNSPRHKITGRKLDHAFLEEKRKRYKIGYAKIRENQDVAEYLSKDFFHDEEWIIPINLRHVITDSTMILKPGQGYAMDPDNIYYTRNADFKTIEHSIMLKHNQPAPFYLYLREFSQIEPKILSGHYVDENLVTPMIKNKETRSL